MLRQQERKSKIQDHFWVIFLIDNQFDFLLSTGMIEWQDIQIAIDGNALNQEQNEYQNNVKKLNDNTYKKHTRNSVAKHKNADHLSEDEIKILANLMS